MTIDFTHYMGREQAFVKHTFLDKYLPALIGKVCSKYNEFIYIDGFAGPWKSAAGESFDDTSFGIALKHMSAQRALYLAKGRDVKMRAFLVERDREAFAQLEKAILRYPCVETKPLNGLMERYVDHIAASIPIAAFSFTLIDPKGFPDVGSMMPLLKRRNAEALVNFMFDFANRFGGTDLIPKLEVWLSARGNGGWRDQIKLVTGVERELMYEDLAVEALRSTPGYLYAPVITVDKVLQNRPLYKLIFLSRHSEGLKVFRDSEERALDAQATVRSLVKARKRSDGSVVGDLFADGADAVPNDRSSLLIRRSRELAIARVEEVLNSAGSTGLPWNRVWPMILADLSVTRSWLGRQVNDMRKRGVITAPGWPSERKEIPDQFQRLISATSIRSDAKNLE